jgi:hypothetical protein
MPGLYAGSLYFDTENIEAGLRGWIDWTATADPRVTTSIVIVRLPPLDVVPDPLRGKTLLNLRFAFPGPAAEGEELAAPLRALAPVYVDEVGEMQLNETARIHNDPGDPGPGWIVANLLTGADQDLATKLIERFGPDSDTPYIAAEVRHIAGATADDVPEGSAAGGRGAPFTFGAVSNKEDLFEAELPAAAEQLKSDLAPWIAPVTNINFAGALTSQEHFETAWPKETLDRLAEVRRRYDPGEVIAWGSLPGN